MIRARGAVGADGCVGGADEGGAAGGVVVEREDDAFDAEVGEALEQRRRDGRAAERGDVVDAVGAEDVDVEDAFDERELALVVGDAGG